MMRFILKNGFYYKGNIIEENFEKIILRDFKNKIVEISKDQIAVREELD